MYYKGEGVPKDLVRAYAWLNLAAAQGTSMAEVTKKNRDGFEKEMTGAERSEGQQLASNWKKGDTFLTSSDSSSGTTLPKDKPSEPIKPSMKATGTAFSVSSEGHALTNHHVINGCSEIKVAGQDGVAKVITSDSINDLALLQLPGKSNDIAKLNPESGKLRQGEDVIVFGYPLNFVLSSGGNLTPGTLSALTGLGNKYQSDSNYCTNSAEFKWKSCDG
jgi:S1-C subfamily serine protease